MTMSPASTGDGETFTTFLIGLASTRLDRSNCMSNAQEKRVNRIAELKGFRLERAGHGKGHGRFYIMDVAEGGRMRSGIPDHEYSFSLEEAEAWLAEAAGIS
jgi:hypothetical protein